jgi:hypothetical protein
MDFEFPDLSALSGEALREARASAHQAALALNAIDDDDFTDENSEQLNRLLDFRDEADKQITAEDTAASERAATRERAAAALADPEPDPEPEPEPESEATRRAAPEPVTAGAKRAKPKVTRRAAGAAPEPVEPRTLVPTITAAADVPGFVMGSELTDLDQVARGFMERFRAMPRGKVGRVQNRYGVASITFNRTDGLVASNYRTTQELIQAASVESRLRGGSLTAAGGWCAPSETLYDLCTIESTDGLWDLPSVQVDRGGIQFTKGPNFADFYAYAATAFQTEAEAEAGTEKLCIDVECPPFEEVRLDAAYVCVKAGILTNAAYPELVRRYIEGTLIAQQHAISARLIADAEAITGAAIAVPDVWANATSILTALELVAEGERERFRMARSATLEVLLPYWVRPALRADLSNRTGVDLTNVTDGMLDAHFANRGLRVQWLYNYQQLDVDTAGIATDYPTTLETIMYPAGTFVMLTDDVIRLDAVYDSVGLSTNTYTAMFAEEGIALANVCHDPRRISFDLCVSGNTAAAIIEQCFGQAPAE